MFIKRTRIFMATLIPVHLPLRLKGNLVDILRNHPLVMLRQIVSTNNLCRARIRKC